MGQIVSLAAKPKRCNLNQLSQVPTPAAGEHILVSSDNSMNAAGQGNFDCYIKGDGQKAATALELKKINPEIDTLEEEISLLYKRYNAKNIRDNSWQNYVTGAITEHSGFFIIEGIPVFGFENIKIAKTVGGSDNAMGIIFYNSNDERLSGYTTLSEINVIVPDDAVYANLTVKKSVYDSIKQLLFQPYQNFSSRNLKQEIDDKENYLYKRYNAQNIKNNYYQNYINGNIISNELFFVVEGIPVRGYEKIDIARTVEVGDNAMGIVFYGSDGTTKVGGNGLSAESINTIIVPDDAFYANLTVKKSVYENIKQILFHPYSVFTSKQLDNKITEIARPEFDINSNPISGEYIRALDGAALPNSNYKRTDYIELFKGPFLFKLNFGLNLTNVVAIAFYDENKNFVFSIGGPTSSLSYVEQEVDFSEHPNVRYFRASLLGTNLYAYCKSIDSININIEDEAITTSKIKDGAVTSSKIKDEAVTEQKTIFFEHDPNSNFIDKNKLTPGYYIAANGVPIRTGSSNYFITDKVFLTEGETYYKGNLFGGYCAFYKEDGTLVQGYGGTAPFLSNPFVVPQETVYGRFTLNVAGADQTCWISKTNVAPEDYKLVIKRNLIPAEEITPKNYSGRDISTFSKIMCIGDSLTEGAFNYLVDGGFGNNTTAALLGRPYSYPQYLAKLTGCEVTNLGKSGYTSSQWYDYYTTGEGADTDFSGYDCAIIQLGVNDNSATLDTVTKTALDNIINKVKTANAGIKIFFAGIINAKSYPAATEGEGYYAKDQWLRNYYNTYYANDAQVFFIDHVAYGHLRSMPNAQHGGSYPVDNYNEGHLSAYGYWRLAQDYVSIIGYIMSHNNAQDFRKIQFIGTNYQCY